MLTDSIEFVPFPAWPEEPSKPTRGGKTGGGRTAGGGGGAGDGGGGWLPLTAFPLDLSALTAHVDKGELVLLIGGSRLQLRCERDASAVLDRLSHAICNACRRAKRHV